MQEEDLSKSLLELLESPYGFAILASEAVALLAMAPFVYLEVCTVIEFGPSRWLSTWNLINMITYILQVFALRICVSTPLLTLTAIAIHRRLDSSLIKFFTKALYCFHVPTIRL
jgi:hypothetical protein